MLRVLVMNAPKSLLTADDLEELFLSDHHFCTQKEFLSIQWCPLSGLCSFTLWPIIVATSHHHLRFGHTWSHHWAPSD